MTKMELVKGGRSAVLLRESGQDGGVLWALEKLERDIRLVTGVTPESTETFDKTKKTLVAGIAGKSAVLSELEQEGLIDLSEIREKREVFGIFVVSEDLLVIAGSDKRGTIYGIFELSEKMGVSPFVDWSNLPPKHRDQVVFTEEDQMISKEPSVEYRGFFINDEWPAFGNWANKHFGGVNAKMYEHVFELLLRMKGNYLWPAMWGSEFALEGPGLLSAELADKLGVVMGLSHHEPCLRHGNEYGMVRGKDSIYGDAWNFRTNPDGITRFWRDGLKRNGHLENVITVGMRGEADSAIMGKNATLGDNIELLKDVLRTQNRLIREEVNEDLTKVPRMLALYKEVEPFYFGDEQYEGLRDFEELRDVILMLCDDNHGYLRSIPDDRMRKHPGGFGMYYHFDYYGDPKSYLWTNTTYLPEVWEQMTTAYESGIRRLWIVNVGDLGFNELPLSYFLKLAYDYDTWGIRAKDTTKKYLEDWLKNYFDLDTGADMLMKAERMIHNCRTEHLSDHTYHPVNFCESERLLSESAAIMEEYERLEAQVAPEKQAAFYELVGYSVLGTMNILRMWLFTGMNHFYAAEGMNVANRYGDEALACLKKDAELTAKVHEIDGGRYDGFGLSEHMSFVHWNMEEMRGPVIAKVCPIDKPQMKAGVAGTGVYTVGGEWTGKPLFITDFLNPDVSSARILAGLTGGEKLEYKLEVEDSFLQVDALGELTAEEPAEGIRVRLDREAWRAAGSPEQSKIRIKFSNCCIRITALIADRPADVPAGTFLETAGRLTIFAKHFSEKKDAESCRFEVLEEGGRRAGLMRLNPSFGPVLKAEEAPYLDYTFYIREGGVRKISFVTVPTNPHDPAVGIRFAWSIDGGEIKEQSSILPGHKPGIAGPWYAGTLDHMREVTGEAELSAGLHTLRIYGIHKENVLEEIRITDPKRELKSYLGEAESPRA